MAYAETIPASLGHALHEGLVVAGLAAIALLLLPAHLARWSVISPLTDNHTLRVQELRVRAAAGTLALPRAQPPVTTGSSTPLLVPPVVLVSALAASGVHAAVAPLHLTGPHGGPAVAAFFWLVALAQLGWVVWAVLDPRRSLLLGGAVGHACVLVVWAVSRTIGLPDVEPLGPWDLSCAVWEACVVVCAGWLLRGGGSLADLRGGVRWHPAAAGWLLVSVVALGMLSISGAPA